MPGHQKTIQRVPPRSELLHPGVHSRNATVTLRARTARSQAHQRDRQTHEHAGQRQRRGTRRCGPALDSSAYEVTRLSRGCRWAAIGPLMHLGYGQMRCLSTENGATNAAAGGDGAARGPVAQYNRNLACAHSTATSVPTQSSDPPISMRRLRQRGRTLN